MDFFYTPYIKIIIAVILGAAIGFERRYAGKMAGMRTFSLVSMDSCLLIIASEQVTSELVG